MLHRHRHDTTANWEKANGRVVDYELLKSPLPGNQGPHPKRYTVELFPDGREPFEGVVVVDLYDRHYDEKYGDLFYPSKGDVRGFLFDPASGSVDFDMTDARNSSAAQDAAAQQMMDRMLAGEPAHADEDVSGPPWVLPVNCPNCSAPVDQATEAMKLEPRCAYCHQPLPAEPRARF